MRTSWSGKMAKYDFQCTKCQKTEEKSIPMADYDKEKNKQVCSECGAPSVRVWQTQLGVTLCDGMYGIDGKSGWNS